MPTITNFGDVVTTGNTLLQGNLTVLNTSTTLTGNLLPNVAGSANIGQLSAQFGSSYIQQMNAATLNITSQAFFTNVTIGSNIFTPLANITTINAVSVIATTGFFGPLVGSNTVSATVITASSNVNAPTMNTTTLNAVSVIATSAFYGPLAGSNTVSATVVTASSNVNAPTMNATTMNAATSIATTAFYGPHLGSNLASFLNVFSSNSVTTANVFGTNVYASSGLFGAIVGSNLASFLNVYSSNSVTTTNVFGTNVYASSGLVGAIVGSNVASFLNVFSSNSVTTANVFGTNVYASSGLFGAIVGSNVASFLNVYSANSVTTTNVLATTAVLTNNVVVANTITTANLITQNISMSSNLSTNTGFGNVYLTGNLVVNGNIFSSGGSVGSGSGTSQGVLYTLGSNYTLPGAFSTGTAGPSIAGYHINMASFTPEATAAVTAFGAGTGMLKFTVAGLYQLTCVIVGDRAISKVAIGKTASASFPPSVTATAGYDYVYNYPVGASPSEMITIPLTVTDISQYYYLDAFFSTASGAPTVLYPTRSTTAAGTNFGTYIQVGPFGNYLSSATGVAAALLCNSAASTTLSGVYSSNTYRIALTTANGWTVSGTSTSLAVTANGNFQVNQAGIYEVNLCLNTVGNTPVKFQVGSLSADTLSPSSTTPLYLYSYSPMYTQDPTTVISLPLNITNVSNVYFVEVSFPGTVVGSVPLSTTSTFVSIKPIGGFINTGTNPWTQQGTSVYYNGGPVGLGVVPTSLTETLTVSGNTSFVGNVVSVSDVSSSLYTTARRVPAGSLSVSNYVTGSVPLTTTTNLIQNYLSNAATITSNTGTGTITQALSLPGTVSSGVIWPSGGHSIASANLALSNLFIEAWVNPVVGANQIILARTLGAAYDLAFSVTSGGILTANVFNTGGTVAATASNATALVTGTWYHVSSSYQRTGTTAGTLRVFVNGGVGGTTGTASTQPRVGTTAANVYVGLDFNGSPFSGNVADVRVMTNCIVPVATFTPQAAPFTTAPTYRTGMDTGYTSNLTLALNSQYFPGASTSPYGPCLTLPGTVGSYYQQNGVFSSTTMNTGFSLEVWVNFSSLANSNIYNAGWTGQTQPSMIGEINTSSGGIDWAFGPINTGKVTFGFWNGSAGVNALNSSGTITTGQWTHLAVQSNSTNYVNMFINGQIQTLTGQNGYTPTGNGTTSVLLPTPINYDISQIVIGQFNVQGPNFAIAKARLISGANTYTTTTFTPSPNLGAIPAGATLAWNLESQYPLPTFPSIQDVTPLPSQLTSYGSVPIPVGGVTSNTLSPLPLTSLQSLRFDGTGYIDYGNAASSSLTTNIWATPWTIEAWVYLNTLPGGASYPPIIVRESVTGATTWALQINPTGVLFFQTASQQVPGPTLSTGTWYHVAATYDGARCNVYTSFNSSSVGSVSVTGADMAYTPSHNVFVGAKPAATYYINGNLADVRVSNVAQYTGSSYTVPTAPLPVTANTLLLLRSLGGQVGTTLEVQGRGLGSVSLGAGRTVNAYPPAPMSSYLLDTTSNASVTYGQGKYIASASSEYDPPSPAWKAFDKGAIGWVSIISYTSGAYTGSVRTVDVSGTSWAGEWIQIQIPVSVLMSGYVIAPTNNGSHASQSPVNLVVLGSRDGLNWVAVDYRQGITTLSSLQNQNSTVSVSQAFNFFRMVFLSGVSGGVVAINEWTLNGTEEGLCVTNDSKVGVGIANPQRSLEVAGDLVVGGTISGGAGMGMFRNRIINGDMRIAQRGVGPIVITSGGMGITADRFSFFTYASTSPTYTQIQNSLSASDTPYQLGLQYSHRTTISVGAIIGVNSYLYQIIEGYNISDFNWGTSFGQPVTLSFWFRTNAPTGVVFSGSIGNSAYNTSYNFQYTSTPVSGQWQYLNFTIPPPPNGSSWNSGTNLGGIVIRLWGHQPSPGGNGLTSSINAWLSGNYMGTFAAASTPWWTTAGNYIEFTGVQLERGTVATGFEIRPYATELALCQRYWEQSYPIGTAAGTASVNGFIGLSGCTDSAGTISFSWPYKVTKRIAVTPSFYTYAGASGVQVNRSGLGVTTVAPTSGSPYADEFGFGGYALVGAATAWVPATIGFQFTANAEL